MEMTFETHFNTKEMKRSIKIVGHKQQMVGTLQNSPSQMKEALDYTRRNPNLLKKKERERGRWEENEEIEMREGER